MSDSEELKEIRRQLDEAREIADDYWERTYKTKIGKILRWYMETKLRKLDRIVSKLELKESGMALANHLRKEGRISEASEIEVII